MPFDNIINVSSSDVLLDNNTWTNRFQVLSQSSGHKYVIAQNSEKKYWGCSCPAWRTKRKCKHLDQFNLHPYEKPFDAFINMLND